jgi:hypothetical protein
VHAWISLQSGAPGIQLIGLRGRADQGVKYLMSQLSIPGSAYRIPVATASQQTWQDWFDKLSEINVHFDIADETIVHTCTGHLPNTDRIV